MNYYKILGVSENANLEEIKEAFRQKAMQCHPDRFSDPKEKIQKTKEFQTINEAYMALSRYFEDKCKREEAEKEAARERAERERQEAEEQERRKRERQEKEERERREREEEAQNQGLSSGFEFHGLLFEPIKFRYRYESVSEEEIKRHNAFTPPEEVERVTRILKPFGEGGSFFDATSPISEASLTVRFTNKGNFSGELLFTKNGAYNYSWKGTFQLGKYRGSAARFMKRDFKELVNSAYYAAMDWGLEIVQNGHPKTKPKPAPAKPQTANKSSATAPAPDAPIEWGWALVGGLALVFVCMLIGGREGMLLFGVVVVMSAVLGLVAWITK